MSSFYSEEELAGLGLGGYGKNCLISRFARLYAPGKIFLGDHVRIDDFCIISGHVVIHNYVHISAYTSFFAGSSKIEVGDFCAVSSRIAIYAESDDYSGASMVNPMVPDRCKILQKGDVTIGRHTIIGSGSTILPGVKIGEGVSVGAMSLINHDLEAWYIYAGIPCKVLRERKKDLLQYEKYVSQEDL